MAVVVTAASVQDRDGARVLLSYLRGGCKQLRKIQVDGGYSRRLFDGLGRSPIQVISCRGAASQTNQKVRAVAPPLGGRVHLRFAKPLTSAQ